MKIIPLKVVNSDTSTPTAPAPGAGPAPDAEIALYEVRRKIHPRAVSGWFATWRWTLVWFTQILFYGLPWLPWGDRPAVLFDLEARRFYLFNVILYPQDFIYLTGLLVISAMALFLFTAVAGRLWCGYACPQTVYTEIFMWIEKLVEGDRNARIKLDKSPMNFTKFRKRATKQFLWIAVALWTGFSFAGYFTPIHELAGEVVTFTLGPWQLFWILFYGFATYGNAGYMREQVCKYMCPYARFQSAMFDKDTMIITYDAERGEPRGSRSRKADPKALNLGSCIDCGLCVEVCPTGIDIRKGLQYECIGCAGCIDACNQVMDKMNYPRGLIRYTTTNALEKHWSFGQIVSHVFRPRVLIYTTILLAVTTALFVHLFTRVPLKVDVLRDRGALGREVEDGMIENVYRLQIINSEEKARKYKITVTGIDTIRLVESDQIEVEKAGNRMVPVTLRIQPGQGGKGTNKIVFQIEAVDDPTIAVREKSTFFVPR